MDVTLRADRQRPVAFRATGTQGSDLTALFSGNVTWESDDPSIVQVVAVDAAALAAKAVAQGVTGTVTVRARGTVDGTEYVATANITVEAAPPPPEVVNSVALEFGDEEAIGS